MNQNILLTYKHIDGYFTYDWFETIEDVRIFVANSLKIKEIVECYDCSSITEVII